MVRPRLIGVAAAVAAMGLLAVGCGDDDNGSDAAAPTKQEFTSNVNQRFSKLQRDLGAAGEEFFGGAQKRSEAEFVSQKLTPLFRAFLGDVRDLTPPKGDEQEVARIVQAGEDALAQAQADPARLRAPEGSADDPFRKFTERAQAYLGH